MYPLFFIYGRQQQPSINVTFIITSKLIAAPTSSKYIQNLRDCIKWAHKKANHFQQKEVQGHRNNYDQCSKAVGLRLGDTVYLLQGQTQDPKQVGEQGVCGGWQSYPNLPVYVVSPIDGEGAAIPNTKITCCLSAKILEQKECTKSVDGDGPALVPHTSDALLIDCLVRNQLESTFNLSPEQDRPVILEMTGSTRHSC